MDLWYRKRLLYQLSHNHCPTLKFVWEDFFRWNFKRRRRRWGKASNRPINLNSAENFFSGNGNFLVNKGLNINSGQCDQMARIFVRFGHFQHYTLLTICSRLCPIRNNPWIYSQRRLKIYTIGKISPNLVTLTQNKKLSSQRLCLKHEVSELRFRVPVYLHFLWHIHIVFFSTYKIEGSCKILVTR